MAGLDDLAALASFSEYASNVVLFAEQEMCRGIHFIVQGQVKLSVTSRSGKTLLLRVAEAEEVLGVHAALSHNIYEATAETLRPSRIGLVSASKLAKFFQSRPAALLQAASLLGSEYRTACEQLSILALGASVVERLARFLLGWSEQRGATRDGNRLPLTLNHQEIGECIGVTRESVTRTFATFKRKGIVHTYGPVLMIRNRAALQALGSSTGENVQTGSLNQRAFDFNRRVSPSTTNLPYPR